MPPVAAEGPGRQPRPFCLPWVLHVQLGLTAGKGRAIPAGRERRGGCHNVRPRRSGAALEGSEAQSRGGPLWGFSPSAL